MVADRCFPSSLVHLKKYSQKATFLAFHWRGSLSFDDDLISFFAKFIGRTEVFGRGFFQGNEVLIGGTFFAKVITLLSVFTSIFNNKSLFFISILSDSFELKVILNNIQTLVFALEKQLKIAVKPHSDVQMDSFSLVQ